MHEAQTPNNGANIQNLNSVDSPQSSIQTTNPFHSILVGENKAKKLLLLAPAKDNLTPSAVADYSEEEEVTEDIDTKVEIIIDSQSNHYSQFDEEIDFEDEEEDDWVAEPNFEEQALVSDEFEKLLKLNEELQNANNMLYEQAEQLTTALSESEAALQQQKKRSTVAESMLKQHTQELNAAQAQIQSLFEQLENSVLNVQRQESLADSYKGQLELNQQRLAQLERECALIQNKYTEQTRLLSQSENACRELRTRLKRQQRQTLQFKAALEKSLETSIPGDDTQENSDSNFLDITNNSQLNKLSRTQPISSMQSIKPWSAPTDSYKTHNQPWEEIIATPAGNNDDNSIPEESSSWQFTINPDISKVDNTPDNLTEDSTSVNDDLVNNDPLTDSDSDSNLTTVEPIVSSSESATESATESTTDLIAESQVVNPEIPPSDSSELESELEEQLDSVIQTFFESHNESNPPQSPTNKDTETSETSIPIWKTVIEPHGNNRDVVNVETHQDSSTEDEPVISFTSSMNDSFNTETQDYWEEVSHYPAFDLSENNVSLETPNDTDTDSNSPSPLIYPKRPPKGRKSLASVELPKFSQNSNDAGDNS